MGLRVHSIETFGTHEGPGVRLVVFLQGCHFRCLYCHNPDTWDTQGGKEMSVEEILHKLESQREYLRNGGLTVSGGEPLIQRMEVYALFEQAKKLGFHTTLDTNGSIFDEHTKKLLEVTDLVLLDVKHIDSEVHLKLTGKTNEIVLQFAAYLEEIGKPFWLRYVLVPGWTNQPEYLEKWAKQFQHYTHLERVEILPFHTLGFYKYETLSVKNPLSDVQPPSEAEIQQAKAIFLTYFSKVNVR